MRGRPIRDFEECDSQAKVKKIMRQIMHYLKACPVIKTRHATSKLITYAYKNGDVPRTGIRPIVLARINIPQVIL